MNQPTQKPIVKQSGEAWSLKTKIALDNPEGGWRSVEDYKQRPISWTEFTNRAINSKPRPVVATGVTRRDIAQVLKALRRDDEK